MGDILLSGGKIGDGYIYSGNFLEDTDDVIDTMPDAASDIEGLVESRFLPEKGERRLNQIVDIDIVADGNAVSPDGDCLFAQGFPSDSAVKNSPAMQEMQVWFLGREGPLELEIGTYSSILAWRIPWT